MKYNVRMKGALAGNVHVTYGCKACMVIFELVDVGCHGVPTHLVIVYITPVHRCGPLELILMCVNMTAHGMEALADAAAWEENSSSVSVVSIEVVMVTKGWMWLGGSLLFV